MVFDYSKLRGRIVEVCGTQGEFARQIGLSPRTVSLKLNGEIPWRQTEMQRAAEVLKIARADIPAYFFAIDV